MASLSKGKKTALIILAVILALILLLVSTYFILFFVGKSKFHKGDRNISAGSGVEVNDDEVTYNGKRYTLNKNILSVLFLGVDKEKINDDFGVGKNGQADTIFVLTFDTNSKKIKIIPIPRESMTDVNIFSQSGKYGGTKKEQICLSYAYGKDAKDSSDNTRKSVSRLLLNINVSNYIAMDLKGVEAMTEKIGGLTLTPIEDIPEYNIKNGNAVNLTGETARAYVQSRTEDEEGSSKRLERQKQFFSEFASKAGNDVMGNLSSVKTYYNAIKPYISTDLSLSQITYLVSSAISKDIGNKFEYMNIAGEKKVGEEWLEFYPDNDSLITTILNTFYVKK